MFKDIYTDGTETALQGLGLEKTAFLGAAAKAIGGRVMSSAAGTAVKNNIVGPASRALTKNVTPIAQSFTKNVARPLEQATTQHVVEPLGRAATAFGKGINNAGTAVENVGVQGAERLLGQSGGQVAKKIMKGAPAEAIRQGLGGAAIGGGLQGGMDAAMAEEGQRGEAFLHGAGMGAASGAAFGVLGGGLGQMTKNVRRSNLHQGLKGTGVAPHSAAANQLVDKRLNRGFLDNLTDIGTSQGQGSVANLGGQLSQVGTEWIAPMLMLPATLGGGIPFMSGGPEQPQQPQQPEFDESQYRHLYQPQQPSQKFGEEQPQPDFMDPVLAASLGGSGVGASTVGTAVDLLAHNKRWPTGPVGIAAKRFAPLAGMIPGALTGRYLARQQWPAEPTVTPEVEKLKDIDFDKLMRYYQKRDE